jgi:hypothetical protein
VHRHIRAEQNNLRSDMYILYFQLVINNFVLRYYTIMDIYESAGHVLFPGPYATVIMVVEIVFSVHNTYNPTVKETLTNDC